MMKLGIFCWFGYEMPLSQRLRLIARSGFEATSLWLETDVHSAEVAVLADAPRMARDCGLSLDNGHAPFETCNLLWSDAVADRQSILNLYRKHLDFCRQQQIPRLVLHLSHSDTPPPLNRAGLDTFGELLKHAEDAQVVLAVENIRRPDYSDAVFERFESPHLGLCYDSSHDFLYGNPPGAVLKRWGHLLTTTHFSDNAGQRDDHWLPGDGSIAWDVVRQHFPLRTYNGICHLETFPKEPSAQSAEAFLQMAYERATALRSFFSRETEHFPEKSDPLQAETSASGGKPKQVRPFRR